MRAAVVREFNEDLSIKTVEDPKCPKNGVVLEVAACGVCRSDFHGWVGGHPKVVNGSIMGHEYCGTVVEAGAQAKHSVGDKLIAPFIVASDMNGDCLFERENTKIAKNLKRVYEGTRPATLKRFGATDDKSGELI